MTDTRVVELATGHARGAGTPLPSTLRAGERSPVLVLEEPSSAVREVRPPAPPVGRVEVAPVVRRPRRRARAVPWTLALGVVSAVAVGAAVVLGVLGQGLPLAVAGALLLGVLLVHRVLIEPWHVRWGATRSEASTPLPGDELLDDAVVTTRAVTIDAPVAQVWSWIVELGMGPDGWASPGLIPDERARGGIVPALGDLGGDGRRPAPGAGFEVLRIEAPRMVVSRGDDGTTWCLQLSELSGGRTRLVSRFRSSLAGHAGSSALLADPVQFVRERRMLRGLRSRAETGAPLPRRASPCEP